MAQPADLSDPGGAGRGASLTRAGLDGWTRRAPAWILRPVLAVVIAIPIIVEIAATGGPCTPQAPCRYPPGSRDYYVAGIFEATAIAAVVVVLVMAWWGAVLAVMSQLALLTEARFDLHYPDLWWAALIVLVVAVSADAASAWHQQVVSATWSGPARPRATSGRRRGLLSWDTRSVALLVLVVLSVLAVISWALQARAVEAQLAFETRAIHVTGQVVDFSDEDGTITVLYDAERRRTLDANDTDQYPTGTDVALLVDPHDRSHVQLANEPNDPTGWLYLAVLLTVFAVGASGWLWRLGARRADVVAATEPRVQLRAAATRGGLTLASVDDHHFAHPVGVVGRLIPLAGQERPRHGWFDPEAPGDLADESDAAVVQWAESARSEDDDGDGQLKDGSVRSFPGKGTGGALVTVVGLRTDGRPAVLTDAAGRRWLTGRPIGRPRPRATRAVTGYRPTAPASASDSPASPAYTVVPPFSGAPAIAGATTGTTAASGRGWTRRLGLGASLVVSGLVYLVARWGFDGSVDELLRGLQLTTFVVAPVQLWLARVGAPAVQAHRDGVLARGWVLDRVIPAARVTSVLVGRDSVTLRLHAPDDAWTWGPESFAPAWPRTPSLSPQDAGRLLRSWVDAVSPARAPAFPWIRPTAGLFAPGLTVVLVVVAWLGSR